MKGARPVRHHDPGGVRRPRTRPPHLHRRRRGTRIRLDVAVRASSTRTRSPRTSSCTTAPRNRSSAGCRAWRPARSAVACRCPKSDAGSDTRNIACRAVRDGDEYVITGTKMWVTNGERAGIVALAARTEEGISCFIVEKEPGPTFGGITVSRNIGKLGYKGIETVEMTVRRSPHSRRHAARRSRPRARLHPRRARGRSHQHRGRGRAAWHAPRSTRR